MAKQFLQKFYVYDPGVYQGDELGTLRVLRDEKDGNHVMATPQMVQWWIDQGLVGREPLSKLSGPAKKLLAQITRGRSEGKTDSNGNPVAPKPVPKYSKRTQSGSPSFAATPASVRLAKRGRQEGNNKQEKNGRPRKSEAGVGTGGPAV